jgi:CelD/BcsL family acetyltransferase involved in cellulose biosynthesis
VPLKRDRMPELGDPHGEWERGRVPLNFQIGDVVLARSGLTLYRRSAQRNDCQLGVDEVPQGPRPLNGAAGYVVWSQPIADRLPKLRIRPETLVYAPRQYHRYSVDLTSGFKAYMTRLSGKTRSTLKRKLRKFTEISHGAIDCREYRTPEQMRGFIDLARSLSAKTYQEQLLGRGLPATDDFLRSAQLLAGRDSVRAYLLFLDGRPISYLYCPVDNGVLLYDHLGYDPAHSALSPGTVLQLLVLEALFAERRFTLFDFTEGEGQHKETFSTDNQLCADIYVINRQLVPALLVLAHRATDKTSAALGTALESLHLKSSIRTLVRRS